LASGIFAIAAAAFFTSFYVFAVDPSFYCQSYTVMLAIILVGVCAGFFIHNCIPARVFMGDTGMLLIGLLLASITITVTGEFQANAVVHFDSSGLVAFLPILLPLLALALPLADLVLAVVRRTLAGKSPFAPDKKHLHHRLLE